MRHWDRLPREAEYVPSLAVFQGQAGRGSKQPGLVEGIPACGGGGSSELDGLYCPFQARGLHGSL